MTRKSKPIKENPVFTNGKWRSSDAKVNPQYGDQLYYAIEMEHPEIVKYKDGTPTYKAVGFYYPHSVQSKEESEANVRLMAAAPELLESLKRFIKFYDSLEKKENYESSMILGMREAISKATITNP